MVRVRDAAGTTTEDWLTADRPRMSPEGHDPESTERVQVTGRLRRLLIWSCVSELGVYLSFGAVPAVLLPLQVEALNPADKAANLAVITVVGALAAAVAQPVAGILSDRTRSRFGRRAPWIVGGAVLGSASMILLAGAASLPSMAIAFALVYVGYNAYQGPLSAVLPDRVPRGVRGLFSALAGLGVLLGILGGQILGAVFSSAPFAGYAFLAALVVITGIGFVKANPDHDNRSEPKPHLPWSAVLRTFWVNPVAHPDFAWGFLGRFFTMFAYYLISSYQLYLLQDYLDLGDDAVRYVPIFSGIALVATVITVLTAGPLSDRMGRRKPLVFASSMLLGLSTIGPWLSPTTTGFAVYATLAGLGFGAYLAVDRALLSEVLPAQADAGKDIGVLNIAVMLPAALAPGAAGVLVTVWGYSALFPAGLAASVLGAVAVLAIKSVR